VAHGHACMHATKVVHGQIQLMHVRPPSCQGGAPICSVCYSPACCASVRVFVCACVCVRVCVRACTCVYARGPARTYQSEPEKGPALERTRTHTQKCNRSTALHCTGKPPITSTVRLSLIKYASRGYTNTHMWYRSTATLLSSPHLVYGVAQLAQLVHSASCLQSESHCTGEHRAITRLSH